MATHGGWQWHRGSSVPGPGLQIDPGIRGHEEAEEVITQYSLDLALGETGGLETVGTLTLRM